MKIKNLLLIPALMGTMAMASDYSYELTPVVGYNFSEGNLHLKDELMYGLEMQFNNYYDSPIKPELSILMSNGVESDDMRGDEKTNVLRFAVHGVYELEEMDTIVPFVKAGVGYEHMNTHIANNTDGPFVSAGAGVKYKINDDFAIKLEALYSLKYNKDTAGNNAGDSNVAVLAGLTWSFGKVPQAKPVVFVDGDDDNDGVLNSIDECLTTPPNTKVNTRGCTLDADDDNDGVTNAYDKCPNSPAGSIVDPDGCCIVEVDGDNDNDGVTNSIDECPNTHPDVSEVDAVGCAVKVNLHVNFEFDSFDATKDSHAHLRDFVNYMDDHKTYKATIVGHTDNMGSASYNQTLSEKRADAVKALLIKKGLSADKMTTVGKGEINPTHSNDSEEGRAENRRVEAHLIK